ncbi:hypothetical protein EZS27_024603 [termite gut metagenome]|uniref:Surface glycan-binding protein B xyloglucan binding domain-containing protein n=1 Tax=termite gut metagenome TaxID=433724 RepID=A0A5J4QZ88_9ZZZZ
MNKKFITLFFLSLFIIAPMLFSCEEDDENDSETAGSVKIINISPVVAGQHISITGSNIDQVTAVIFPPSIEVKDFKLVGKFEISVPIPTGAQTGTLTLRTPDGDITTIQSVVIANPAVTSVTPEVEAGGIISIRGKDLGSTVQVIFPVNDVDVVINALDFIRKTENEIKITVPMTVSEGSVVLKLITSNNTVLTTPTINLTPAPEETIDIPPVIVMDFEQHGGHNGGWDNSWANNTEIITQGDNSYLRVTGTLNDWILNCNHQSNGAPAPVIENIEKYVLKLDVMIEDGVSGAENAELQFVFANQWNYWYGAGLLPATTNGKWVTVEVPTSYWNLTGTFDLSNDTYGLHGGPVPGGVCFDNLRFQQVEP